MEKEELGWYQCKLCPERLKTTIELQRHKRLVHRNSNGSSSSKSIPPPSLSPGSVSESGEVSEPGLRPDVTGEITSTPSGRHLTCACCRYKYDTKDTVILHLLKLCRRMNNGCLKCPFCVKVKLPRDKNAASEPDGNGTTAKGPSKSQRTRRRSSPLSRRNADQRTRNATSGSSSSSSPVTRERRRAQNQTPDTPTRSSRRPIKQANLSQRGNRMVANSAKHLLHKKRCAMAKRFARATRSSASTPAPSSILLSSSSFNSSPSLPSASSTSSRREENDNDDDSITTTPHFIPASCKRSYEIVKQPQGTSSSCPADDPPRKRKLSILTNNQPVSADSFAFLKWTDFGKNDIQIQCQYCEYVAQSLRPLQYHMNAHLAKSYPCDYCSHIYRSKQSVLKHMEKNHPGLIKLAETDEEETNDKASVLNQDKELDSASISTSASTVCGSVSSSLSGYDDLNLNLDNQVYPQPDSMDTSATYDFSSVGDGNPIPSDHQLAAITPQHRQFFMFGRPNNTIEKVVKLENF